MTYDEFVNRLSNLTEDGRFSFGYNWLDFVKNRVNEEVIAAHMDTLKDLYPAPLPGARLIDIGCGSGISSLCFRRIGYKHIHSIDLDEHSVAASKLLRSQFDNNPTDADWLIEKMSILDADFVGAHKQGFDVVHSWGVLHHTGNMWQAIRNAAEMVADGGLLHLALYKSGGQYTDHIKLKCRYDLLDVEGKKQLLFAYLNAVYISRGVDVFKPNDIRGMNAFNDALDWLGGLPYEVCDEDVLTGYLANKGFARKYFRDGSEGGNFVVVYRKV